MTGESMTVYVRKLEATVCELRHSFNSLLEIPGKLEPLTFPLLERYRPYWNQLGEELADVETLVNEFTQDQSVADESIEYVRQCGERVDHVAQRLWSLWDDAAVELDAVESQIRGDSLIHNAMICRDNAMLLLGCGSLGFCRASRGGHEELGQEQLGDDPWNGDEPLVQIH